MGKENAMKETHNETAPNYEKRCMTYIWKLFENGVACLSNTLLTIHLVSYGALLLYTGNERDGVGCCEGIGFCWEYCYGFFIYFLHICIFEFCSILFLNYNHINI